MGSTPTICAKSSTLRGAVFYFYSKLCKVGFEQPVPGALRPALATVLRTVARARENPTVCAKYHYSISHWVVIFYYKL